MKLKPRRKTTPLSLLAWRTQQGWSQREAAQFLEMSQTGYAKLELGQRYARTQTLARLIARTGVPVEVLAGVA